MENLREELAGLCHEQWSGWMNYLFSCCIPQSRHVGNLLIPTGDVTIPAVYVARWRRQMKTAYPELSPREQDSDRIEADKFLSLIGKEVTQ